MSMQFQSKTESKNVVISFVYFFLGFLSSFSTNLLAFYHECDLWLATLLTIYLTIRLRARVFYEQIVNEAQPSWITARRKRGRVV